MFDKKRAVVFAIAYKTNIGTVKLQQHIFEYDYHRELDEMREKMKAGVKSVDGVVLAISSIKLK
jgi:hypothetical protein